MIGNLMDYIEDYGAGALLISLLGGVLFVAVAVFAIRYSFGASDPVNTRRILAQKGYQNIEITGFKLEGCVRGEYYKTGFEADFPVIVSRPGETLQIGYKHDRGVVCGGNRTGYTIRIY